MIYHPVGVLSLLVTILIGWNIYTIIDIKNTRDKIDEISTGASLWLCGRAVLWV